MHKLSTLCYIERDGKYLMLHRTVKENDINKDKWIGVGGHFEEDESPEECVLLLLQKRALRNICHFLRQMIFRESQSCAMKVNWNGLKLIVSVN